MYVEEPTNAKLENLVYIFPRLKELSLLSDEELAHWPNELVRVVRSTAVRGTYLGLL